ncbi:hypothetical protein F5Y12DRAFT_267274 [Xylaria sp. FL1777]|nr:hypothetical protein F5Y12DRAFT_267274 [Xylaria sp. FL1777]
MNATQPLEQFDEFARISQVFTFDNTPFLATAAVSFVAGYAEYIYSILISLNERKGPFPLWLHLFYFAHDTTWIYVLSTAGYDHWFFFWCPVSFSIWAAFEVACIYRAIFVEGEEISSDQLRQHGKWQSLWYIAVFTAMMYGFMFLALHWMGIACFLELCTFCNMAFVFGSTSTWARRGSRDGLSVGLALCIVVGTVFTFAPFGMMVQAAPEIFDHPAYYFLGAVLTVLAVTNAITVANYPPKTGRKGQKSAIW